MGTRDLNDRLTVFVLTIGDDANFGNAMRCLERQTVQFRFDVVRGVAPLHEAFNQMHRRCETPYFVQVDEDMMLFPHAIGTLFQRIVASPENVAIIAAPLWDCDVEMPIQGVKIYRHQIVAKFPYEDSSSCDIEQMKQLLAAGYEIEELPLAPWHCLGEHGKFYTPRTIFQRWQRLVHKQRRYPQLRWVESWPQKLRDRYRQTGSELHFWAFLGAVSGIVRELPAGQEQDFRVRQVELERLEHYFGTSRNTEVWRPSRSTRVIGRLLRLLSRLFRAG